jgi:hypothetical protein
MRGKISCVAATSACALQISFCYLRFRNTPPPTPTTFLFLVECAGSGRIEPVIACDKREALAQGSAATKQSSFFEQRKLDWFAEPVIGRRFAPTRRLAMTE